jgi:transketolase
MPMGCADIAAVLWTRVLRYNPADPDWANRDRFVLSAGHGSMLLYSVLHLAGYAITLDDIRNFRQLGT